MGSTAKPQTGAMATVTKGLFQKSLRDIITGIRANKDRQKDYMNKCLQDIRAEVSFCDVRVFRGCRTPAGRAFARGRSRRGVSRSRDRVRASNAVTRPNARRGSRERRHHDVARPLGRSRQFSPSSAPVVRSMIDALDRLSLPRIRTLTLSFPRVDDTR